MGLAATLLRGMMATGRPSFPFLPRLAFWMGSDMFFLGGCCWWHAVKYEAKLEDGTVLAKSGDEGTEFYLNQGELCGGQQSRSE